MNVTAPYNFVPLASLVCKSGDLAPGLSGIPAQDIPIDGALCGSIPFTLCCDTKLLIGDGEKEKKGETHFLQAPDGTPVIPGSSLRGMVRNVMEIATFARFSFVDDQRIGVRDLGAMLDYRNKVSHKTNGAYAPKVKAGWLQLVNGKHMLTPCNFGRIDHCDLSSISSGFQTRVDELGGPRSDPNERNAKQVQEAFLDGKLRSLEQTLFVQDQPDAHQHHQNTKLYYRRVAKSKNMAERNSNITAAQQKGVLVFTGLPGPRKHMEFFFYAPGTAKELSADVWGKFVDVHEKQEKPNQTWLWRRKEYECGNPIPVFWLPEASNENNVAQIGLAMMFKLAADNTIHEMISHTSTAHKDAQILDLPTRIFGRVALDGKDSKGIDNPKGFKTRVSFGFSTLTSRHNTTEHKVIAASPKPSFVPSYIRQRDFGQADGRKLLSWERKNRDGDVMRDRSGNIIMDSAQYRSYMTWENTKEELRGWKRYPARGEALLEPPEGSGDSASNLFPISNPGGLEFVGHIRYHNLHPIELGALVWALTWGGNKNLRHGLGMGKPFGWGQVAIRPVGDYSAAITAFTDAMQQWAAGNGIPGGWAASPQITQLKAMADPLLGESRAETHLKQMKLDPHGVNEFKDAKAALQILPEYTDSFVQFAEPINSDEIKTDKNIPQAVHDQVTAFNQAVRNTKVLRDAQALPEAHFKHKQKVWIRSLKLAGTIGKNKQGDKFPVTYQTKKDLKKGWHSSEYFPASDLEPIGDKS